jgi:hypothetical protein
VSDDRDVVPRPDPADGSLAEARLDRLRVAAVELIPLGGTAGDELEARQDAAIREVLLWLQRRQEHARLP